MEWLNNLRDKTRDWAKRHAQGPWADFWLMAVSFSESSFFLIPSDVLLIAILLTGTERWVYYSSITTIFSVLGGVFAYLIGFSFFGLIGEPLVNFYHLEDEVILVSNLFSQNAFWTVFIAAFTPLPYKVVAIAAGLFKINLLTFIVASLIGRGLRYFAEGLLMRLFGDRIAKILYERFSEVSLAIGVLIIILIISLR